MLDPTAEGAEEEKGICRMVTCSACGTSGQPSGAKFCAECGAGLARPGCPACGAEVAAGAKFCSECGAVQAAGGSAATPASAAGGAVAARRVTSVLFGDLVGFTSLSESRDQEDVRELLSGYFEECRQIIARYGGTVEKFIGDAVMAVWGVPTAHEDDAERAVRAGLELVHAVAGLGADQHIDDLAMRVGIVTGEVAVTIGAQQQGMVAGDAVNTAARVQSAASPGQVWVDETTRLLTSAAISYVDVGSHVMKGKADPVPLWSVRAVVANLGGSQRADGLEAPLIGRDRELRMIKEVFHSVEEAGRPAMLVVSGEPGVGKTRLAWEYFKYIDGLTTNVRWHSSRCLSYGEGVAFYALAEAVRGRLQAAREDGGQPVDSDEDQAALLRDGLAQIVPDDDERAWLEPRLAALLGIGAVASFKREDLFNAWATFLRLVGAVNDEPVILVIDDAHYADDGLVAFLEHLMAVATFKVYVLLMARPGLLDRRPELAANRRVTVLHLETLSDPDMGNLLDGLVAGLPAEVRSGLVERAEGIPLYAVETVRSLIDRDLVLPRGGQYVLADHTLDLDGIGAPASLHALMSARLDALPPDQRRVVDVASVIGHSFTREQITAMCPDVPDLASALAGLVRVQVLRQESDRLSAELGQYQFVQSAVRQVAHGTLSRRDRKALHLGVARLLEAGDNSAGEVSPIIAGHVLEAVDAVPEAEDAASLVDEAVDHLERAATRAASLGAPAEAAAHLRIALERTQDRHQQALLGCQLAHVLNSTSEYDEAIARGERARAVAEELGDRITVGRASAAMALALVYGPAELDRARTLAEEQIESLRGVDGAERVLLELHRVQINTLLRTESDLREAAENHARLADRVGDESDVADSYISLALHFLTAGPRGLARVLLQSAAERARAAHDPLLLVRALTNLNADWAPDDARVATEFGRAAVAGVASTGDLRWISGASINLMLAAFLAGEWDEALALLEGGVIDQLDNVFAGVVQGSIATARGLPPPPVPEIDAAEEDLAVSAFLNALRAQEAVQLGLPAGDLIRESADQCYRQGGLFDDFATLWQFLSELAWSQGDRQAVDDLFGIIAQDKVNRLPTGFRAQGALLRARMGIADDLDATQVEQEFRTALTEAGVWNSAPTEARVQAEYGAWLVRQERAEEAEPLLAQARATFERLGAVTWLAQLETVAVS
jgi:class 3 adenylate cyclase/predicted ATPase